MAASLASYAPPAPFPREEASLAPLAILIPAWKPTPVLLSLVHDLLHRGFAHIVIVDDGSGSAFRPLLSQLAALPQVQILRHTRNRGKGRSLKTGLAYLWHIHPSLTGVVSADADGQHLPEDIERVARALLSTPTRPVFGVRRFAAGVPLRSRLGNTLTRAAFSLLTGTPLSDTQTGLRALPRSLFPALLTLPGNRYEYETAVLAYLCRTHSTPQQVPISTVYLDGNRGSHFHPVLDSLRIYRELLRSAGAHLPLPMRSAR